MEAGDGGPSTAKLAELYNKVCQLCPPYSSHKSSRVLWICAVLWKVGVSLQQDYCLLALQVTSFIGIPW